jgi:hypothetical protein
MRRMRAAWLVSRVLYELVRFDVLLAVAGFARIERQIAAMPTTGNGNAEFQHAACTAMEFATALYFKPVRCLQRSVCLVRLLRKGGLPAKLVIGYRPVPFLAHAWAQVEGRVVHDSPVYPQRMRILHIT